MKSQSVVEERIFVGILTIMALVFLLLCLQASSFTSIRVPLLIVIPTLIGLLWQLGKVFIQALKNWSDNQKRKMANQDLNFDEEIEETSLVFKRRILFSLWLILLILLIYYLGFLYALLIGLVSYFRLLAKFTWKITVYSSVSYLLFIYLFFVVFLKLNLF